MVLFTDMRARALVGCLMWMQDVTRISMVGQVGPNTLKLFAKHHIHSVLFDSLRLALRLD